MLRSALRTMSIALPALALIVGACGGGTVSPGPAAPVTVAPAAAATVPATPVEIRFGHGTAAEEQAWLMIAKPDITPNQGKWYTLKVTQFRASDERLSAFEAGQLDAGTMPVATALFAADKGVPMKLMASIIRESVSPTVFKTTFLTLDNSGIKSAKDLKDKTIGVVGFKTATESWTRAAAASAGLDPAKDIKLVVVGFPAMGEALRAKRIDVGAFPQPFYAIEKARGGVVEAYTSRTGAPYDEDNLTMMFNPDFVAKHPGVVRAFLSDYVAATKYYLANEKSARQTLIDKKFSATAPEVYLTMLDYQRPADGKLSLDGLKKHHDELLKAGWISKAVDLTKLVDLSFLP